MKEIYKNFPQINELFNIFPDYPKQIVKSIANDLKIQFLKDLQKKSKNNLEKNEENPQTIEILSKNQIIFQIKQKLQNRTILKPLINATGVVLHTNFGRALIDEDIYQNSKELICSYSNLEFDLNTAKRGDRYEIVSKNLSILFGCEDAILVNNNAAAVFLVLNTIANNHYAITSRSEIVEIGGSFRVNEVAAKSGVKLVEIGTSNKTHIKDYEIAIKNLQNEQKIILKTHKSNFYQEGFVSDVDILTLIGFAKDKKIPLYYDLGGGSVDDFYDEIGIKKLIKSGVDLLSFSGDKLFGGVQCGVILGAKKYIDKIRQNQLLRMLRVSKIEIIFMDKIIEKYLNNDLPISIKMLKDNENFIKQKAQYVFEKTMKYFSQNNTQITQNSEKKHIKQLKFEKNLVNLTLKPSTTLVGAGSSPGIKLKSWAIVFECQNPLKLSNMFKNYNIIGKLINKKFYLDFRSIRKNECEKIIDAICQIFNQS